MAAAKSIVETINEHLAAEDLQLPVRNSVGNELRKLAEDGNCSFAQLERLLLRDQALASQILKVSNSSFYMGLSKVTTVRAAISRLGLEQIVSIALLVAERSIYQSRDALVGGYMAKLWKHALACALGAKWLAAKSGFPELAYEAFMAGLFHDIGKLLLLKVIEDVRKVPDLERAFPESLLIEVLDTMHAEQGYRLVQRWNLPEQYAEIAHTHHQQEPDANNTLSLIVRLVDRACAKIGVAVQHEPSIALTALPETGLLGIKEVTLAELEIALEDAVTRFD
jgi:putative nucleotidyltransferase with HDIG domain